MIAAIAEQSDWTTTFETPLRADLHWAIESRLGADREWHRAGRRLAGIGAAVTKLIAHGTAATAGASRLRRDLAEGTCLETIGDVEVRPGRGDGHPGEVRVNGIVLRLDRQSEREAVVTLGARGHLHGATVCYSPNARMLLEIVTADGILVYRPPELRRSVTKETGVRSQ